ncbi:MAG: tetratricopeptide repeat protein [Leptolyngbyaceae cyanobacterium]
MKKRNWTFSSLVWLSVTMTSMPLVTVPLTIATAQAQQNLPAEVRQGYQLLQRGWVNEAIAEFQQAVKRYPQSAEAQLGLAIAYRRAGNDAAALQAYEQVLKLDPDNQLALRSIGLLGGYRPEWQVRGIEALTRLLNQNPGDIEARAQRALLYGYQERFQEALREYEIVLQAKPSPEVILSAAQVFTYAGNYQGGLELFNRYRQQTGKQIEGYAAIAYARALRNTGNPAAAIQLLEPQLPQKLDNLAIQMRAELSQAYLANQQPTQALSILTPLRGRPEAALPLARALNELGRQANLPALSAEAASLYRQVISQTANPSPLLLEEVADVLSRQPGQQDYALQLYRQLVQSQPDDRALQVKRLALEQQLGYISRSQLREGLRPLLQPLPADLPQRRAIAQALVQIDPEPEFLPVYLELLQTPTVNQPFLNFRVAQILVQRNDLASARNYLAVYAQTPQASTDLAPQLLAAEIERREGNLNAAAQRYESLIATNPRDPDIVRAAYQGLATIRVAQGRFGDALLLYDQLITANPQDFRLQLARASIAYQAQQISLAQAEAVLNSWLSTRPPTDMPPELFDLVGTLPADTRREVLYVALTQENPYYLPVQVRLVQVLAQRDPVAAQTRVAQLVTQSQAMGILSPTEAYLLQAQLAEAINNPKLAEASYAAILAQQPYNAAALAGLGNVRFQQRQFIQAEQLYKQSLAIRPDNRDVRRSLIEVNVAQDDLLTALNQVEQLQVEQGAGTADSDLARLRQRIGEDFLLRRGFQPSWERY